MKRIGKTETGDLIVVITSQESQAIINRIKNIEAELALLEIELLYSESPNTPDPGCSKSPLSNESIKRVSKVTTQEKIKEHDGTNCDGEKECLNCGKLFPPPRKTSRFCSKKCTNKFYHSKQHKPTPKQRDCATTKPIRKAVNNPPADGAVPLYRIVAGVLSNGPQTSRELVLALGKQGVETTGSRLGVMLSTYKKVFVKTDGRKWTLAENKGRKTQKHDAGQVTSKTISIEDPKKTRLETLRKLVKKDKYVPPVIREDAPLTGDLSGVAEFQNAQREAA